MKSFITTIIIGCVLLLSGFTYLGPVISRSDLHTPYYSTDFFGTASATTQEKVVPWDITLNSTGTISTPLGTANHPGLMRCTSSTTINSGCGTKTHADTFVFGGGEFTNIVFRIDTLTDLIARLGFTDTSTSTDSGDGAYIEIPSSGNAVCKTANNSVRTTSATIATLVVATFYHARVTVNPDATEVTCEIFDDNGTLLGSQTNTTNIPTARETGHGVVSSTLGVVAVDLMTLDFMDVGFNRSLVRGR